MILKYTAESDPEYKSALDVVNTKNFLLFNRGGLALENHLFAGGEDLEKPKAKLSPEQRTELIIRNKLKTL